MKVSLIIATYNWPQALELAVLSASKQSKLPDEIIIADDGSTEETRLAITKLAEKSKIPIIHLWQEDNGFQKTSILNKAFAKSKGEYIIQIDGDIILHHHFIKDHLGLAKKNAFIQGGRVLLGPEISSKILSDKNININIFSSDIKRRKDGIRFLALSNFIASGYRNRHPKYFARGANMSFWREDLVLTNGYNEDFSGWGHEDSELTIRLMNAGKQKLQLKFGGIAYHIYHKEEASKKQDQQNKELLENTVKSGIVFTPKGLNQYLDA